MTREELQKVRDWADAKIATGEEPPWSWYQFMKLRETLDAILAGMDATKTVDLPSHLSVAVDNTKPIEVTMPI